MGACAQTSCGKMYVEWKVLKESNKKGIYPPNQIEGEVTSYWNKIVGKDETFANKDQAKQIATKVVNGLGSGGNGIKFEEDSFTKQYKKIDMMGLEKNPKASIIIMITAMMAP